MQNILQKAPFAYAYHQIIYDDQGNPCDYRFLEVNLAFGAMTNLDTETLIGKTILEVLPELKNDKEQWAVRYGKIAQNCTSETFTQYSEYFDKWYYVYVYSVEKGFFATIFIDQTEQIQKTEELESFFSVSLNLLCIADSNGQLLKINRAWEAILGYSVETTLNKKITFFVHPDDLEETQKAIDSLKENSTTLSFTNRCITKNGEHLFIEWNATWVNKKIYASARDITKQKLLEESLIEAKNEAEKLSESKSVFLSNLSHEIRTPLHALLGISHLLLNTPLNNEQQDLINKTERATRFLLDTLNNILDHSKIEAGKLILEKKIIKTEEILDQLRTLFASIVQTKNLDFYFDVAPNVPEKIRTDSVRLLQILINLISNSIKFTPQGKICLKIQYEKNQTQKDVLKFSVEDTGIGIPKEKQSSLFEPFSQISSYLSHKVSGTGLGLVISSQLVKAFGGSLEFESEEGKGSTFFFDIPITLSKQTQTTTINQTKQIKTLIIEHDELTRELLKRYLEHQNVIVDILPNYSLASKNALLNYEKESYDIIFISCNGRSEPKYCSFSHEQINYFNKMHIDHETFLVQSLYQAEINPHCDINFDVFLQKPVSPESVEKLLDKLYKKNQTEKIFTSAIPFFYGKQILIADDNELGLEVSKRWIEKTGAKVIETINGRQAVDKALALNIDLGLIDIRMPELNGIEATKLIREKKPNLPLLSFSAAITDEDKVALDKAGVSGYIQKPFDEKVIFNELKKYLQESGSELNTPEHIKEDEKNISEQEITLPKVVEGFNLVTGLHHALHDTPFYVSLLKTFYEELNSKYNDLHELFKNHDSEKASSLFHTLKSSAAILGAKEIEKHAKEIDEAYKAKQSISDQSIKALLKAISSAKQSLAFCNSETQNKPIATNFSDSLRGRILIIDDEEIETKSLTKLLQAEFNLIIANSGEECIKIAQKAPQPDIILLDVNLPGIDGYETCRQLKESDATRHISIIFITGRDNYSDEEKGFKYGGSDYIKKPYLPMVATARIRNIFNLKIQTDTLEMYARTDSLTGIANRRSYEEQISKLWNYCLRDQKELSVIMLDIDHFKAYNDFYGHGAGDDCLRRVAKTLQKRIRRSLDIVARYGGEEFIIILPETKKSVVLKLAIQICEDVKNLMIPHKISPVDKVVTISAGCATMLTSKDVNPELLVKKADEALYTAKKTGRNRAVHHDQIHRVNT